MTEDIQASLDLAERETDFDKRQELIDWAATTVDYMTQVERRRFDRLLSMHQKPLLDQWRANGTSFQILGDRPRAA